MDVSSQLSECFRNQSVIIGFAVSVCEESLLFSMLRFAAITSANVKVGVMDEESEVIEVLQTTLEPSLPSQAEAILAKDAARVLATRMGDEPLQLHILADPLPEGTFYAPASALPLLVCVLEEMARGNAVVVIPVHAELTTQEAADMLNISGPSLIQLLDEGKIEFRRVGTHRRVRFEALMEYKRQADAERGKVLRQLAAYDQELGI